jgi:hypothetical protein
LISDGGSGLTTVTKLCTTSWKLPIIETTDSHVNEIKIRSLLHGLLDNEVREASAHLLTSLISLSKEP